MDRGVYEEKLKANIANFESEIKKLEARAHDFKADTRREYLQWVETIDHHLDSVRARFQELQQASDDSWQELTDDVGDEAEKLREAMQQAASQMTQLNLPN